MLSLLRKRNPSEVKVQDHETTKSKYLERSIPDSKFQYITPYVKFIDLANPPGDKWGQGIYLNPDALFSRLRGDIGHIKGSMIIDGLDSKDKYAHYILRQYDPAVSVGIERTDYLPTTDYPKGASHIWMRASYVGEPGLKIQELEEIAANNGLEEYVGS